jgi:hypothetical protein
MRLSDCPSIEASVKINATPAQAWASVTDIELPARFSPELQRAEWVGDAESVSVGSHFRGVNRNDILGEWTTECIVTEVEPERRWTWNVIINDQVAATWGFEIDPARDGILVRQWVRLGPGPSGLSMAIAARPELEGRIVARRLEDLHKAMIANLEGLRGQLEPSL